MLLMGVVSRPKSRKLVNLNLTAAYLIKTLYRCSTWIRSGALKGLKHTHHIFMHLIWNFLLIFNMSRPSVICLSVCNVVARWAEIELSSNMLHRLIAQRLRQLSIKMWAKIRKGYRGSCRLSTMGYEKNGLFRPISRFISPYRHNYIVRCGQRRIGTRIGPTYAIIEWYGHFQWRWVTSNLDFKVTIFRTSNNSKMVHDIAIVIMAN